MRKATEILNNNLKALLKKSGLSQYKLSSLTGIAQPQLSRYFLEKGATTPQVEAIEKLATAFGVKITELFSEMEPNPGPIHQIAKELREEMHQRFDALLQPGGVLDPIAAADRQPPLSPVARELVSLLPSLDEAQLRTLLTIAQNTLGLPAGEQAHEKAKKSR